MREIWINEIKTSWILIVCEKIKFVNLELWWTNPLNSLWLLHSQIDDLTRSIHHIVNIINTAEPIRIFCHKHPNVWPSFLQQTQEHFLYAAAQKCCAIRLAYRDWSLSVRMNGWKNQQVHHIPCRWCLQHSSRRRKKRERECVCVRVCVRVRVRMRVCLWVYQGCILM